MKKQVSIYGKSKMLSSRVLCLLLSFMTLFAYLMADNLGQALAATYFTHTTVAPLNMNASATNVVVAVDFTNTYADPAGTITLVWSALTGGGSVTSVAGASGSYNGTACNTASYFGTSATVLPGSLTAAGSGTTITISGVSALSATPTQYCAFVGVTTSDGMTNPTAGTYTVTVSDTGGTDTSTVGVDYISNDQIVVSATVPPQFTMSLSGNTDSLPTLLISTAEYSSGVTATINTNAANGWLLWAEDTGGGGGTAGLYSAAAGHTIPSVATGSNYNFSTHTGSEEYGLAVASVSSGSANANYAYNAGTTGGGLSTTVFNQIASLTGSTATSDAVVVKEVADIAASTPAGAYTDTVTLVGAGSF